MGFGGVREAFCAAKPLIRRCKVSVQGIQGLYHYLHGAVLIHLQMFFRSLPGESLLLVLSRVMAIYYLGIV